MAGAHVFVDDLERPELTEADRHHLKRSLRLRPGDPLTLSDGRGGWRPARMGPTVELDGPTERVDRPAPAITVAVAPGKGDRPDWAVQKMTELGVDRVVVFTAARSVVRWEGERAQGHLERLRRIAREASMQSRRMWLPAVEGPSTFADLVAEPGAVLAAPDGEAPSLASPFVLVGPEGGWTEEERAAGIGAVALGVHVLRSETAAVTAAALLGALRGRLV